MATSSLTLSPPAAAIAFAHENGILSRQAAAATSSPFPAGLQVRASLPRNSEPLAVHRREMMTLMAGGLSGIVGSSVPSNSFASAAETSALSLDSLEDFTKKDNRRMLHVVYRVGDIDKTIKFYTECLGMKLLRQRVIPEEKYTNAFLGYGSEDTNFSVELTYNYGQDSYDIGTGFGHFGLAVEDVQKTGDLVKSKGGKVSREPGPVKGGSSIIAFVDDPDGYKFELIQRPPTPEPFAQVCLRVGDLDKSIAFYEKAFGMSLLSRKDVPQYKYAIAKMGYGSDEMKTTVLELTYNYGVSEYTKGTGYAQIAVGTDDVYKTAEAVRAFGGQIIREPGPLPILNTKITAVLDPDGWKSVFVDNIDLAKELEKA
jgi:lactoylglutathione lyase